MDTITPEMRSKVMSAIHSRDTLPEVVVRKMGVGAMRRCKEHCKGEVNEDITILVD